MMNRQVRNIANAYILIAGLVLLLLLLITIKVVDVYYDNETMMVLDSRATQLESIYTNYSNAGSKLKQLNTERIDSLLLTRAEGIKALLLLPNEDGQNRTGTYEEIFSQLEGHKVAVVPSFAFMKYIEDEYGIKARRFTRETEYFDAELNGSHWRIVKLYVPQKDSILLVGEDVTAVDGYHEMFVEGIDERIKAHMRREPMDVAIIMINNRNELEYCSKHFGDHEGFDLVDMRTGESLLDIIHEIENGKFEYQIMEPDGLKEYLAFTRLSKKYDNHLILSFEKKSIVNRFGERLGMAAKLLFSILVIACIWTAYRFKSEIDAAASRGVKSRKD